MTDYMISITQNVIFVSLLNEFLNYESLLLNYNSLEIISNNLITYNFIFL